mmetsp:Transcript_939/g.2777  ORF Transcript_939/g.2777 Transcript_939/m.2777 type:complete len:87 (-) Transcript_939:282-542(-)
MFSPLSVSRTLMPDAPTTVDEKEKLVAKLEMILLEAKREPSSEQAEMLHVPSTSSSTSALGTTPAVCSCISFHRTAEVFEYKHSYI